MPAVMTGAFAGAVTAVVMEFFLFYSYNVPADFPLHILYLSRATAIPTFLLCLFWTLFSGDSADYKTLSLFPLVTAFYAVFLPYRAISGGARYSFFFLIIDPLLMLCTAALACASLCLAGRSLARKKYLELAIALFLFLAAPFAEPLIQAMWYFRVFGAAYAFVSAAFAALAVFVARAGWAQS